MLYGENGKDSISGGIGNDLIFGGGQSDLSRVRKGPTRFMATATTPPRMATTLSLAGLATTQSSVVGERHD